MLLTIATAPHRFSVAWQNTEIEWLDLVKRLRTTTRTGETVAEYKAMTKSQKSDRKDIGGFVGGYVKDGKRINGNIVYRQLITLDADSATKDFAESVALALMGYEYVIYSTHSHTPDKPRVGILIPLDRRVEADEYIAIGRRLAADIGIEMMDTTTYEPTRLMYWPSTPQDGEYYFYHGQGDFISADGVLATYDNWRDTSTWPTSKKETAVVFRSAKRQEDPYEKKGLIGAFCRAYTITEAMRTFLQGTYEPTVHDDRFTYVNGSTTGGLVVYDDKFAYSHHSTDPISGKLCNAFDLVRIHLFGELDEEVKPNTPPNRMPSFSAMCKHIGQDELTLKEVNREKAEELKEMFTADGVDVEDIDFDWMNKLERSSGKSGEILASAANFILILKNDALLKGAFGLDEFAHRLMVRKDLPWRKRGRELIWTDMDDASLRNYLSVNYGLTSRQVIDDALSEVMTANRFHPVREYLDMLVWDGVKRAESVLLDWLGVEDSKYARDATMTLLKAAVARVMIPGVKFDPCLVLSGPQGIGKSTVLRKLGVEWFNDSICSFQGKDAMEQLQGSWIIELSEMQATNKSENDLIKAYISRQVDRFRAPYGRRTAEFPRQCVFTATTNDYVFLKDRTGGRRFWPMFCKGGVRELDELTEEYVGQIWAEVYEVWKKNGSLLLPKDSAEVAKRLQESHTEGSEKAGIVAEYLDTPLPEDWNDLDIWARQSYLQSYGSDEAGAGGCMVRDRVCVLEIWCEAFGGNKNNLTNANSREINAIMQNMDGWEPYKGGAPMRFGKFYGRQRAYIRTASKLENRCTLKRQQKW